jgi:hypothetical protein
MENDEWSDSRFDRVLFGRGKESFNRGVYDEMNNRLLCTFNDTSRNRFRKDIGINRFTRMRRVTKFNLYKVFNVNGEVKKEVKAVDLTRVNLRELVAKANNTNYFELGLPLPVNKVSRVVGVYAGPLNSRGFAPNYEEDFDVKRLAMTHFTEFQEQIEGVNVKVLPGNWAFNCKNIEDMASSPTGDYKLQDLIDGYFSRIGIDLVLPNIGEFEPRRLDRLGVNGKLLSKSVYSYLQGDKRFALRFFFSVLIMIAASATWLFFI